MEKKNGDAITGSVGASKVFIGRYTYGINQERTQILQWGEGATLHIGAFCSFAKDIRILLGGNHRVDWITTYPFGHVFKEQFGEPISGHPQTKGDVNIGNDVWIGQNTTIMSGVSIGDGAVVAAGSHVNKSIGAYQIWGGNPVCFIKKRFDDEIIRILLEIRWWEWPEEKIVNNIRTLCQKPTRDDLLNFLSG